MLEAYDLMNKDEHIGTISYFRPLDKYYYVSTVRDRLDPPTTKHYPAGLFEVMIDVKIINGKSTVRFLPILSKNPTSEDIREWLANRIMPDHRQNLDAVLEEIGMDSYDLWELTKYTRSMCYEDNYWLRFRPSEKYEKIHIRYLTQSGNLDYMSKLKEEGVLPAY